MRYGPTEGLALRLRDEYGLKVCIETGTYWGESTSWAAENFERVISLDISEEYQNHGKERCAGYSNITFLHGDTRDLLPKIMEQLNEPALFWLDAHSVAGLFGPTDDCPILFELETINKHKRKHFILIDDAHCFVPPVPHDPAVWPKMLDIQTRSAEGAYAMRVAHDVIVIVPPFALQWAEDFVAAPANPPKRKFHMNLMPPKFVCRATALHGEVPSVAEIPEPDKSITELVKTAYGKMLVPRFDTNQTPALRGGYALDHAAFKILSEMVKHRGTEAVLLDVGANVGTFSFALRDDFRTIHAFEAQRIIFNMLCGSVALNGWEHIHCYNVAVSDRIGKVEVPKFDYSQTMSFGSIEFGPRQKERLHQDRQETEEKEFVQTEALDSFLFPRVDLLKIDVEGFEFKVLDGARSLIDKFFPIIFVEHGKVHAATLRKYLSDLSNGYEVRDCGNDFLCTPHMPIP